MAKKKKAVKRKEVPVNIVDSSVLNEVLIGMLDPLNGSKTIVLSICLDMALTRYFEAKNRPAPSD